MIIRCEIAPVCGMELEPAMAYSKTDYAGRTFYFCSKNAKQNSRRTPRNTLQNWEKKQKKSITTKRDENRSYLFQTIRKYI